MEVKYDNNRKLVNDSGHITFECPMCKGVEISRSREARVLAKKYNCPNPKCGFQGP